jgi:hypothetical protein
MMNQHLNKERSSIAIEIVTSDFILFLSIIDNMSLNESSPVVKCQSDQFDSIRLTTAACSSNITLSSSSIVNSPLAAHEFTTERIIRFLKNDSTNYKVIRNTNSKLSSVCWHSFGSPDKKCHLNDEYEPIPGFVICQLCFQTYTFLPSSGTRILNAHNCTQKLSSSARKRFSSASASELVHNKIMK